MHSERLRAVNQVGPSVSIDNLGENVTNAEEARESAHLYHQLLDEIRPPAQRQRQPETHPHGPRRRRKTRPRSGRGLVAKAAAMTPRNFVRVDMEGSPYTQRTLDFVHELHRVPAIRAAWAR